MKSNLFRKIAAGLAGYDIFISYRQSEAQDYAKKLHELLEKKNLVVFRDESEVDNLGTSTERFAQLAKNARCFVTIVSPGVYQSNSVYQELSTYFTSRIDNRIMRPFSRIISIDVDQSLSKANTEKRDWQRLSNFVYEPESLECLTRGEPSEEVVNRLASASTFMNSWRRFLTGMAALVLLLCVVTAGVFIYLNTLSGRIESTKQALQSVTDSTKRLSQVNSGLIVQKHDLELRTSQLTKNNSILELGRETLEADKTRLQDQKIRLTAQAGQLDGRVKMLRYQTSALSELENDPILSYKFAQEAYRRDPQAKNRQLILASLSNIDFYYERMYMDYQIMDFKEPFVLVKNKTTDKLAVFDSEKLKFEELSVQADYAWVIPFKRSWRLLTRNFQGAGMDAIPEYQLWNNSGKPISSKVQEGGMSIVQFIKEDLVSIKLYKKPQTLIWDLSANAQKYFEEKNTNNFGENYFYQIYGPLATRKDGISAGHFKSGLALFDASAKVDSSSYTPVSFDPSAFFSRASWSEDGKYLALNYFDRQRLGIWNPANKTFLWLDPHLWVVNAYCWSKSGHLLAFSGRTENETNITVEIVDAAFPERSRKVIYRGEVPIQQLVFLPGDDKLLLSDKSSRASIVNISTGNVMGTAKQAVVIKSGNTRFYSSNNSDFKVWNGTLAPSKKWLLYSDSTKAYSSTAAVESSGQWAAIGFENKVTQEEAIELRNLISGETKKLTYGQGYLEQLKFSENGIWLLARAEGKIYLFNIKNKKQFSFTSPTKGERFNDAIFKKDLLYLSTVSTGLSQGAGYGIDLAASAPGKIKPYQVGKMFVNKSGNDARFINKMTDGWKLNSLYKYYSYGWIGNNTNKWAMRVTCRDQALGASDCDIQFVPLDLTWLMKTYDSLLWKPGTGELDKLAKIR